MFLFGKVLDNSWGPLYLLLLDRAKGSGMVDISMSELSNTLQRSSRSINRYLTNTIPFRKVLRKGNGLLRVFLGSLTKVREYIGGSLGPRFEGDVECLLNPKHYAALSQAIALQSMAMVAVSKSIKTRGGGSIKRPEAFFTVEGVPSQDTKGSLHVSMKGNVPHVFMGSSYLHAGASLEGLSKLTGRSISTLQRYLRYVNKVRVLHYHPSYYIDALEAKFLDSEDNGNRSGQFYRYNNFYFRGMTNVYYPELTLCGGDRRGKSCVG